MKSHDIDNIVAIVAYIKGHLQENLDLDKVAAGIHYSQFHLHRMFAQITGITIHDYIRWRKLTEAERSLAFSKKPILEIALAAGYEGQQAFTGIFKSMYKRTPIEYKRNQKFYPLQLAFGLNRNPLVSSDRLGGDFLCGSGGYSSVDGFCFAGD